MEPSIVQGEKELEMTYETYCSEILDLFRAAGKDVPHEDSDMGRAVAILQEICDSQNHTIPSFNARFEEMQYPLCSLGWSFYSGTAASNPYAKHKGAGSFIDANSEYELQIKVLRQVNPEHDIFNDVESNSSDIFEALEEIESHIGEDDFTLDFDGNEYRIISESDIWEIYVEEIKSLVEDCYSDVIKLDKIPAFIAVSIDWEQTAKNAYVDGYAHQFSTYCGDMELQVAGYWIFRTNWE